MSQPYEILQEKCHTLRLVETAKELPNLMKEAEPKGWTYHEFIHKFLNHELHCREIKNKQKLMKWAEFPELLTFDPFRIEEQTAIGEKQLYIKRIVMGGRVIYRHYDGADRCRQNASINSTGNPRYRVWVPSLFYIYGSVNLYPEIKRVH